MGAWEDGGQYSVNQSQSYKIVPLKDRTAGATEKLAFRYVLKGENGERIVSRLSPFIQFENAGLQIKYNTAPTLVAVSEGFGYRVSWPAVTNSTYPNYMYTEIYESKTLNNFSVAQLTDSAVTNKGNSQANSISLATGTDFALRYVRIRHVGYSSGQLIYSPLSNIVSVTPTNPVDAAVDSVPPGEVVVNSAVWSGDNIVLSVTVDPDTTRFVIKLQNGTNNPGYFYKFMSGTSSSQTLIISSSELYDTFQTYYTSFSGIIQAGDKVSNFNTGTAFTISTITNSLAAVTPSVSVTAITNGYTVTWLVGQFAKVYEGSSANFTPDITNQVYGGESPAIVKKTVYDQVYIKVIYYDKYNRSSLTTSAIAVTPINSISADIIAPAAPATVSATQGLDSAGTIGFNGYLNISWASVSDTSLRGYRIRFRPVTNPSSEYSYVDSPGSGTIYRLGGLACGATYEIGVASYDEFNNTTASYTAIGTNIQISGTPFIGTNVNTSGYFSAGVAGDTGEFRFGYGVSSGKRGLVFNTNNYWYIDSAQSALFKIGGSSDNYVSWNGTKLQVDGDLGVAGGTTIGGNISMGASGASIYQGTLNASGNLTSDGFLLNSGGLTIKKGSVNLQLNTSDGGIYADYGRIAGWTIDSSKFEKLVSSNYSGISTGGTYAFYAGSSSSGGNSNANFYVTPSGTVQAKNINISGGSLVIGSKFSVASADGKLTGTDVDITGDIKADTGRIGNVNINSGALYIGSLSGDRVQFTSGGIQAIKDGNTMFSLSTSNSVIAGWTINSSSLSSGGSYPLVLDQANSRIVFSSGAAGSFTLDHDNETITTYTVSSNSDTGDIEDSWYYRYYTSWNTVSTTLTEENSISLKKTSASGAQPSLTLSTANYGFARLKNISSNTGTPSSEVLLQDGGIYLNPGKSGGLKISNLSSAAHYTYNGISTSSYAEIGTSVVVKSDGTITTGRAFYKSAAAESSITNSDHSVWPQVGRVGDIIFSTND